MTEKEFYKKVENIFGKEYVFKCRGSHSCDGFHYLKLDENVVGHAVYILFKVYKMKFNWNGIYYITKKIEKFLEEQIKINRKEPFGHYSSVDITAEMVHFFVEQLFLKRKLLIEKI